MFGCFLPDLIYLFNGGRLPAVLTREAAAPPKPRKRKWKGYKQQRRERGRRR